jgi:hypothetical protein
MKEGGKISENKKYAPAGASGVQGDLKPFTGMIHTPWIPQLTRGTV